MGVFCQYKDIFGAPNTGVHSYRLFNIAVVDLGMTIVFAGIITIFTKIRFIFTFSTLMLLAIFLHWLFCVDTTINKLLF